MRGAHPRTRTGRLLFIVALLLITDSHRSLRPAGAQATQTETGSSKEAFEDLNREFEAKSRAFIQEYRKAKTDEERRDIIRRLRPDSTTYAERFLDLARQQPRATTALDALARAVSLSGPGPGGQRVAGAVVEQLRKDWIASPRLGEFLFTIGHSALSCPDTEPMLREILERNPGREARAHATYALGSLLSFDSDLRRLHAQDPKTAERLERRYGKEQLERLLARDPLEMHREAEGLMERVVSEYSDVQLRPTAPREKQTLGNLARAWLDRNHELAEGHPAPEIEGTGIDGQPFKLSDYRGKVVVVVFWASWCGPCMAMIPHERDLVRRLADQPFALLGVNCDRTLDAARAIIAKEAITWPNWYDGSPESGKIAERYSAAGSGIPAVFVIDGKGVIRSKDLRGEALDKAVDALLAEREAAPE